MKICIVYRDFDSNVGDAYDVRSIAIALLELDHEVVVYCSKNSSNKLHHKNLTSHRSSNIISTCVRLVRNRHSLEVVHLFCGLIPSLVPISWICRFLDVSYVYSPFGQILPNALKKSRFKKIIYLNVFLIGLIRNAKFIHVISDYEKNQILNYGAKEIVVSPLSIQGYEIDLPIKPKRARYVTFIGRLDIWHKGLDYLLRAASKCKHTIISKKLTIVIAGRGTQTDIHKLKQLIALNQLENIVEVRPDISDVEKQALLAATKIFIHPSRVEGFARSMREVLSLKIPIVTTFDSNFGDYINQYEVGSASALDADLLAESLSTVVEEDFSKKEDLFDNLINILTWTNLAADLCFLYKK